MTSSLNFDPFYKRSKSQKIPANSVGIVPNGLMGNGRSTDQIYFNNYNQSIAACTMYIL